MINVELKGGVVNQYEENITPAEIAKSISMGLYKNCCAAMVDGKVCDLRTELSSDCKVELLTFDDEEGKKAFWHTTSHILAQAVKRLYPEAKLAIGPSIDEGFYYDFDVAKPFDTDDILKIEAEMKKIVKENLPIERFELPRDEAVALMKAGQVTPDGEERAAIYADLQQLLADEVPYIPLYYPSLLVGVRSNVSGLVVLPNGSADFTNVTK